MRGRILFSPSLTPHRRRGPSAARRQSESDPSGRFRFDADVREAPSRYRLSSEADMRCRCSG